MCEHLHRQHQTFLGLPHSPALSAAFTAMVQDHYNNLREEDPAEAKPDEAASHQEHHASAERNGAAGHTADGATTDGGAEADLDADDEGMSNLVGGFCHAGLHGQV